MARLAKFAERMGGGGADGGTRTPTSLSSLRPERSASANFATSAHVTVLDRAAFAFGWQGLVGDAGLEPAASRM